MINHRFHHDSDHSSSPHLQNSVDDIGREFIYRLSCHNVSHAAKEVMWRFLDEYAVAIAEIKQHQLRTGRLPCYKTIRTSAEEGLPEVTVLEDQRPIVGGETTRTIADHSSLPRDGHETIFQEARVTVINQLLHHDLKTPTATCLPQVASIVDFHRRVHGDRGQMGEEETVADLSVDGVKESRSGRVSLNVFSLRFDGCRHVYPLIIQRPTSITPEECKLEGKRALEELIVQLK